MEIALIIVAVVGLILMLNKMFYGISSGTTGGIGINLVGKEQRDMDGDDDDSDGQFSGGMPDDWMTNPAYWWMVGNIYYDQHNNNCSCSYADSDWMTNPCCSHIPGNIYHQDTISSISTDNWTAVESYGFTTSTDDEWSSGTSSSYGSDYDENYLQTDNSWSASYASYDSTVGWPDTDATSSSSIDDDWMASGNGSDHSWCGTDDFNSGSNHDSW